MSALPLFVFDQIITQLKRLNILWMDTIETIRLIFIELNPRHQSVYHSVPFLRESKLSKSDLVHAFRGSKRLDNEFIWFNKNSDQANPIWFLQKFLVFRLSFLHGLKFSGQLRSIFWVTPLVNEQLLSTSNKLFELRNSSINMDFSYQNMNRAHSVPISLNGCWLMSWQRIEFYIGLSASNTYFRDDRIVGWIDSFHDWLKIEWIRFAVSDINFILIWIWTRPIRSEVC